MRCYAFQNAYEQALSRTHSLNAPADMKVPAGTHWSPPVLSSSYRGNELAAKVDPPNREKPSHVEADNFDGDQVLANSVLFLEDFGWWIEAAYVIPEGDMGRVNEILKVFLVIAVYSFGQLTVTCRYGSLLLPAHRIKTTRTTCLNFILCCDMKLQRTLKMRS